jgi:hypothetical protein
MAHLAGKLFPIPEDLAKRYEKAVSEISTVNPVLGFKLRSKPLVTRNLTDVLAAALETSPNQELVAKSTAMANEMVIAYLDDVIIDLAKRYGRRTRAEVQEIVRVSDEPPEDLLKLLQVFMANMNHQADMDKTDSGPAS